MSFSPLRLKTSYQRYSATSLAPPRLTSLPTTPKQSSATARGLRTTSYKKRTVIAYAVIDHVVSIIGIFYGGQDYETMLHTE